MSEYKNCCLFDKKLKQCGPCKQRSEVPKDGLCAISELKVDVSSYFLQNLRFKDQLFLNIWNERKLIENRVGRELSEESFICAFHRNAYGVGWRPTQHCCHPDHPPYRRGTKTKKTEQAPMWLVQELNENVPYSFPVGGKVCRDHKPEHPEKRRKVEPESFNDTIDESFNNTAPLDESFQPEEISVPMEIRSNLTEVGNQLTSLCNMSPLKFQVVKTPINKISNRVKHDFKKKLLMVKDQSVRLLAEALAPNQGDQLLAECFDESSDESEDDVPDELKSLARIYIDTTDKKARIVILSLVDHSKYSKRMLRPIFGCSDRAINTARRLRSSSAGLNLPETVKFRRNRLDMTKANNFIDFIFTSGMIQDVAYGLAKIQ